MEEKIKHTENVKQPDNNFSRVQVQVIPPSNIIYNEDCIETMRRLPDKCVSLIIADPPYYKIKGEFDWRWKTFDEYLDWMEGLAKEFKRILADNGSLFVYGDRKNIAYVQVRFDKYFNLENNIVWEKPNSFTEMFDTLNSFPNRAFERLLMYSQDSYNLTGCIDVTREYLRNEIIKARGGINLKEINTALGTATNGGGVASSILSLDKSYPSMITQENYEKLQKWLGSSYLKKPYDELRQEYEKLKSEYEASRRPFNNIMNLTDVWKFNNDAPSKYDHPTVKPLKMSKAIVGTCSREGDLIYIPFVGSGSEVLAVNELNRIYLGSEIKKEYCEIAEARIRGSRRQNYDMFYDHKAV